MSEERVIVVLPGNGPSGVTIADLGPGEWDVGADGVLWAAQGQFAAAPGEWKWVWKTDVSIIEINNGFVSPRPRRYAERVGRR
jgi:hypothetical protein